MAVRGTVVQSQSKKRLAAIAMVVISAVLVKMFLYDPVTAAQRHDEVVTFHLKGAVMAPLCVMLGIVFTVIAFVPLPEGVKAFGTTLSNPETKRMSGRAWALAIVLLAVSFGVAFYVKSVIGGYGYDV